MTTRKILTPDELERITTAGAADWSAAVVETYRCFGLDMADPDCPRIRPADFEIPSDQWSAIAEACGKAPGNELGRVNHMLDWMNYAPSGFEPEQVSP